jgi:Zn-dependent peptidase ImmA (M78 family)/predicted secreted protein
MTRQEVLTAVKEATSLSNEFVERTETCLDLISVAESLDIPVMYRPLDNIWGGAVTIGESRGVIIRSNLPRSLQRFTLAHEIGHIVLGHQSRFDDIVGLAQRATDRTNRPVEEIAADEFASELLASDELIKKNSVRKGWSKEDIQYPEYIYQLSLRLGISFEATCWSLVSQGHLNQTRAKEYSSQDGNIKEIKNSIISDSIPRDPHADVWLLSEDDAGVQLEASEEDVFKMELEERSSSGYCWELLRDGSNIKVVLDDTDPGKKYGSSSSRKIGFKIDSPGQHTLKISHRRSWSGEEIRRIELKIDNRGSEEKGLPRKIKQKRMGVVA